MLAIALVLIFVTIAAGVYYVGMGMVRSQAEARIVALQKTRTEVLEATFAERALAPLISGLGRRVRRLTPVGWPARTERRLRLAGWSERYDANSWGAIKVLAVVGAVVAWLPIQALVDGPQKVWTLLLMLAAGVLGPDALLNRTIGERRDAMRRQLPDVLDLLVISVEAGLGFEAALARVVRTVPGEMSVEFAQMLQETRVGVARSDAMKALSERTDLDELDSFLLAMGQAEAFGVSISRVLRVQSEEMRVARRQRAQERAFAAPVKMVFPLVLCILPAIFVVLLGPAAIEIFRTFID